MDSSLYAAKQFLSNEYSHLTRDDLLWIVAYLIQNDGNINGDVVSAAMPEVQMVDTNRILLTRSIVNALKRDDRYESGMLRGFTMDKGDNSLGLSRSQHMREAFDESQFRDHPIKVTQRGNHFAIEDGRHRFVEAVLRRITTVPVIVLEN